MILQLGVVCSLFLPSDRFNFAKLFILVMYLRHDGVALLGFYQAVVHVVGGGVLEILFLPAELFVGKGDLLLF